MQPDARATGYGQKWHDKRDTVIRGQHFQYMSVFCMGVARLVYTVVDARTDANPCMFVVHSKHRLIASSDVKAYKVVAQMSQHVVVHSGAARFGCASMRVCSPAMALQWLASGRTMDIQWTLHWTYIGHWENTGFARLKKKPCFLNESPFHAMC